MKEPKFQLHELVGIEGRTETLWVSAVDVSPCSCTEHGDHDDGEIYYSINDIFNAKESELKKI